MDKKFKSFADFGQAAQEERIQGFKQKTDDMFERIKGDFDSIPEGPLQSSLPEINWISFVHTINQETGERKGSGTINAIISVKTESGDRTHTWSVNKNGTIKPVQQIPRELVKKYSQEELTFEIASLLEKIKPASIHLTDYKFLSRSDEGEERGSRGGDTDIIIEKPVDSERVAFLGSLKGELFQSFNRGLGLKGYGGVLFKDFIYLDKLYKGNAAFFMGLLEEVDMNKVREELAKKKTEEGKDEKISEDELREATLERYWGPISEQAQTRKELVALGAKRIPHVPGKWQEIIRQEIDSRLTAKTPETRV